MDNSLSGFDRRVSFLVGPTEDNAQFLDDATQTSYVCDHAWFQRCWVLQEVSLAKERRGLVGIHCLHRDRPSAEICIAQNRAHLSAVWTWKAF